MKFKTLGELCEINSGGTPKRTEQTYWEGGTIPWVKISDIKGKNVTNTEECITEKGLKNSSAKMFSKGTILYTIFATIGEVGILGMNACTNQAIAGIKIKKTDLILTDYLYYFLRSQRTKIRHMSRGVAQNNINLSVLRKIIVPIPSVIEQRKIVKVMEQTTNIINSKKVSILKLDLLVKARFVEMFGTYPNNEKNWKTGKIRDLVTDVRYGSSRKAAEGSRGKYPYLRMNNITYSGELNLKDVKTINVPDNELDKCTVQKGDLLFNRTNSKELVGKTCVYDRDEKMVLAGFIIRVRLNSDVIPEFVSMFLNADFSKKMLFSKCRVAVGQANINAQEFKQIGIYIPPINLQRNFVTFKKQVDKSKVAIQKSLDETQLLFDSLMQEYFS